MIRLLAEDLAKESKLPTESATTDLKTRVQSYRDTTVLLTVTWSQQFDYDFGSNQSGSFLIFPSESTQTTKVSPVVMILLPRISSYV